MKQCGQIVQIKDGTAKVKMQRHSSCAGCNACKMGSSEKPIELEAINPIGAREGEWVEVEMESQYVLTAAFMMYMIHLLFLIAGVLIGHFSLRWLGVTTYSELYTAIIAFAATGLSYYFLNRGEKEESFRAKMLPTITDCIEPPEEYQSTEEKTD